MKTHVFEFELVLTAALDETFAYFAEAALPFDPLSRPIHPLFVRPQIERIFTYRRDVLVRQFGAPGIVPLPGVS